MVRTPRRPQEHVPLDANPVSDPSASSTPLNLRLEALEAQLRRVEAALEDLQDAVHRRSQLDDKRNDELLRRTEHCLDDNGRP